MTEMATGARPTFDGRPIADLLASRRWVRRTVPFPHVVAQRVFVPEFYAQLAEHFQRVERESPQAFARDMKGYDASALDLSHHRDGPLGVFVSRAWHDLIAAVCGIEATGDVTASLHHHDPGSVTGWRHNDLNPGWFGGAPPGSDEIRLHSPDIGYHKGERAPGVAARESIRAVSILYYLGNPEWQPGDGGETGVFSSFHPTSPIAPAAVPPVNNSLVLFECTPFSWHTFLSNHTKPRNSVVMWLHRTKQDAIARWGEQSIAYW